MTADASRPETLSAAELGRAVNEKELSPVEVVRYFADRIARRDPSLHAFVYTKFDYAESEAKKLEAKLARGEQAGPFAGVPFALKDFLPGKKGWTHSHGGVRSLIRPDPFDSEFCKAMEAAGGIAVGKTNAPAFGFRGTCDNLLYGPTRNPFDPRLNSGGSSGGSAAAVADGMLPISEGSDGGGSIRIPAAWCGCFGFKASVGTIPSVARPDAWAATHPYCFNGGITKTVEDAAILLQHMARYDPRDPLSRPQPPVDYLAEMQRPLKGARIAWTPDFGVFPVDPEVLRVAREAARAFREAGATVEPVRFDLGYGAYELAEIWCRSICVDTAIDLENDRRAGFDLVRDHADELPREFIAWNEKTAAGGLMDYYGVHRARTALLDAFEDVFARYDLILSPTTVCLPVPNAADGNTLGPASVNGVPTEPLIGWCETFFANFTGHPAASAPAGLSAGGLPVGLQIIGRKFRDADVLAAAHTLEKLRPWRQYYDIPLSRVLP